MNVQSGKNNRKTDVINGYCVCCMLYRDFCQTTKSDLVLFLFGKNWFLID